MTLCVHVGFWKKNYLPYNFFTKKTKMWCNLVNIINIFVYMYAYFFFIIFKNVFKYSDGQND